MILLLSYQFSQESSPRPRGQIGALALAGFALAVLGVVGVQCFVGPQPGYRALAAGCFEDQWMVDDLELVL